MRIYTCSKINLKKIKKYTEPNFNYKKIPYIDDSFSLVGYFQSYKYFQHNFEYIKNIMNIDKLRNDILRKNKHIFEGKTVISAHIRLGDYLKLVKINVIHSVEYYIMAIKHIIEHMSLEEQHVKILIIYEKQYADYVQVNFIKHINIKNVEIEHVDHSLDDWEQMLLMSCCDHNIIASSTFSWWGAYLNTNENKIVCYPEKWFGEKLKHIDTSDMFPCDWKLI